MSNKELVAQYRYQLTRLNALRQMVKVPLHARTLSIQGSVIKEGYSACQSDVVKRGKASVTLPRGRVIGRVTGRVTLWGSPWPPSGCEGWVRVCT